MAENDEKRGKYEYIFSIFDVLNKVIRKLNYKYKFLVIKNANLLRNKNYLRTQ